MPMFPYPPVSHLPGCQVQGLVSYIEKEGGCFWLQREEGAADDISANLSPGTVMETCQVGDCVVGRWEEGWYRGKVVILDKERAGVLFVDYGNMAFLNIKDLKTVGKKDDTKVMAQAIRCRMMEMINIKQGFAAFYRGDDVLLPLVDSAPTDDNPMVITADDSEDVAVALSYIESVGVVWVTPVAVQEVLDTLMGQSISLETPALKSKKSLTNDLLKCDKFKILDKMYETVLDEETEYVSNYVMQCFKF